ncbi:Multiprotein-bridging factor 1 [Smittium culicis]|uniref:Multiprotein-bridging factor 1 n=1 Tax=Smittium culicis TaxID=133412 RepID=A0A1R1YC91_9FUNG|nr:Multiprotein-bridging factor 1 [Smittium culicis]
MSNVGWDDVTVLRKSAARPKVAKTESAVNAAKRSGIEVITEKRSNILNKANHADTDHRRIAKLDRDDVVAPPPKVDISVGRAMQQARQAKSLTQKELAVKINEHQSVINDYEAGRAIPNQQILGKLERVLGVKLRGKNIGEPLFQKK